MKHLLQLLDLSGEEIIDILNFADQLKYELKHGIRHQHLKGKTLGMIFQKSSTRTRVSFEVGMAQLGGSRFSFRRAICRSDAANRSRTPPACFPGISTAS